jgi:hypothetical protein
MADVESNAEQSLEPWAQHFEVRWPPALAFFERRYEVLRKFDDAGLLRAFGIGEDRIEVRLGDPNHLLAFMPVGMSLSALKPNADLERMHRAADLVLDCLAPDRLANPRASFQWIAPSSGSAYDAARSAAASRALGEAAMGRYTDFAAVIDGRIDELGVTYHLEAGVAEAEEIPFRLARAAGHLRGPGRAARQDTPESLWPADSLPKFALFCTSEWTLDDPVQADGWAGAAATFDAVRNAAGTTVDAIFKHLDSDETPEEP